MAHSSLLARAIDAATMFAVAFKHRANDACGNHGYQERVADGLRGADAFGVGYQHDSEAGNVGDEEGKGDDGFHFCTPRKFLRHENNIDPSSRLSRLGSLGDM